jgi:hypothetical protein
MKILTTAIVQCLSTGLLKINVTRLNLLVNISYTIGISTAFAT